jgi:peptidoglycan/LPS O-acetylase OafA/YrhL
MSQGLAQVLIQTLFGGFFSLFGIWYADHLSRIHEKQPKDEQQPLRNPLLSKSEEFISSHGGGILRDVGMIWLLTATSGFVVGFYGLSAFDNPRLIGIFEFPFIAVGFAMSGARTPARRWRHLLADSLVLWASALINVPFGFVHPRAWLFRMPVLILLACLIGGLASAALAPKPGQVHA